MSRILSKRFHPALLLLALCLSWPTASAGSLDDELGRRESRIVSAAYPLVTGRSVWEMRLAERLERLRYRRVSTRPTEPGQFFWGHERFWIYRRAHRAGGRENPALLFALVLRREDGRVLDVVDADERTLRRDERARWLEPELLSESTTGDRALRRPVELSRLPESVWRPVLAAEDARFFDHVGIDGRSLARAMLANVKAGRVRQGGSTITQQLIKNRDLTPKRTLGRKASEALRALALEAEYDKHEILQAYLNQVYLGHVDGLAIHGLGTAARVYFSRSAEELTLAQAALLAGMIQGPNALSPLRHAERARQRRDWVLGRLLALGWADDRDVATARASPLGLRPGRPRSPPAAHFLTWLAATLEQQHPARMEKQRGVWVESTLDSLLQEHAEEVVAEHLDRLRREHPRLRGGDLAAALVALDASSGAVLAYVGGDPGAANDRFDRVRLARRQPGSAIKPLLLLEAFQECGPRDPLSPATRVADEPLRVALPSGDWEPVNFDGRFHGIVDVRTATRYSYNVPFVRIARWCGTETTARRMRFTGLELPAPVPPSFALGAVEATPLELAQAYTVFADSGRVSRARAFTRVERPGGSTLSAPSPKRRRVVSAGVAFLVRDLLRDATATGTGRGATLDGIDAAGKTGTSSDLRDAWFVGDAGGVVTAVWVGLDKGGNLGLTGGAGAAPLWRHFMEVAAATRPPHAPKRPRSVVQRRVDPDSGLLLSDHARRGRDELFLDRALPPRKRLWRPDRAVPVVR